MVKSSSNGSSSIAPFLKKCYEMVDDESSDEIISWGENRDSFIIWDMTEFSVQLLPKYFKHSNFSSFIRQLNIYGFRKIDTDRWEFANDGFIRGQKHLLSNIGRRKNLQGSDQRRSPQQQEDTVELCENFENLKLWKEVEILKTDKNALMQELVKLRQYQENADKTLVILRDRIQGMENIQHQVLSFLVMAMQSPGFLVQLLQLKENNWCVAEPSTMLEEVTETGEPIASDSMIVRYQPPVSGIPSPTFSPAIDSGHQPESDASGSVKDMFTNIDFMKILLEENHPPLIPPSLYDDGEWEKLLLDSPLIGNTHDTQEDKEGKTGFAMEVDPTFSGSDSESFELLLQQMGKSQIEPTDNKLVLGKKQNLEANTGEIGVLATESDHNL